MANYNLPLNFYVKLNLSGLYLGGHEELRHY